MKAYSFYKVIVITIVSSVLFSCNPAVEKPNNISNDNAEYSLLFSSFESNSLLNHYKNGIETSKTNIDAKALMKVFQVNNSEFLFYFGKDIVQYNSDNSEVKKYPLNGSVDTIYPDLDKNDYLINLNIGADENGYNSKFGYLKEGIFYNSQHTLVHSAVPRDDKIYLFTRSIAGANQNEKFIEIYTKSGEFIKSEKINLDLVSNKFNLVDCVVDSNNNIIFQFYDYILRVKPDDSVELKKINSNIGMIVDQPKLYNFDGEIYGVSKNGLIFKLDNSNNIDIITKLSDKNSTFDVPTYFRDENKIYILISQTDEDEDGNRVISFNQVNLSTGEIKKIINEYNFDQEYLKSGSDLYPGILIKNK